MRKIDVLALMAVILLVLGGGSGCEEAVNSVQDGALGDLLVADLSPDKSKPDAGVKDGPSLDKSKPDMKQPDAMQPDALQPDIMQPDAMQPDMVPPPLKVSITYPPRASMLTSKTVQVKGKVTGALSYLSSLKVNGSTVTPNSSGEFTHTMSSKWGMNLIVVDSVDKSARKNHLAQSYHYSTKYWPMNPASPKGMAVTSAALGRLYQKAIDDNNRSTVNDLATILEKVINGLNFDKLIPSTLVSGSVGSGIFKINYSVKKNGTFTNSPFKVGLKAVTGGIGLSGSTSSMTLPISAKAVISVTGKVKITNLTINGTIAVSKKSGGAVAVSVPSLKINYSSLKLEVGSGLVGSAVSAMTSGIASLFKNQILKAMEAEVKKALPGPVKSFVSGFKFATSFTLPSSIGGQTLGLYSDLDVIAFDNAGGNLALNAAVYASKKVIPDAKKGTLGISASYTPATYSLSAMEVGLRYDALNQTLGAAWYGGVLQQDVSSLLMSGIDMSQIPFKISSMKFNIDAQLPPVLQPGTAGNDFDLTVGDLMVKVDIVMPAGSGATGGTLTLEGYISATMGGKITINSKNELVLQLNNTFTLFEIEVSKMSFAGGTSPSLGDIALGIKSLVAQLLPKVMSPILQKFPIPAIDLSALGGSYGIPKGTVLKLQNTKLLLKSYHVLLSGDLG